MSHRVMLVGFCKEDEMVEEEDGGPQLSRATEVSFDAGGANAAPLTLAPPRNSPYIWNMTVLENPRR